MTTNNNNDGHPSPPGQNISVLDRGFVRLVDYMGTDLTVVNAARVSFGKRKDSFDGKDAELVSYLAEHEHTAPFRHACLTFHVKAPIFVFRQWMKHRIASDFNEISGRYVEFPPDEFYVPQLFRQQAAINKQGSEGQIPDECHQKALDAYTKACQNSIGQYKALIEMGVCREQARCVLPLALYSEVYWTASLQAVAHFLHLRLDAHAQWEIQQFAMAVRDLTQPLFPVSLAALMESATRNL
ncbi:MAG: FAD-dependent thymidylate synthase [Holophagaceae bacterium]|jgi:thymidylate synthase (FAD)|nr:FAD-dependent thymidylate synthase [Holophagaceae bacterium]